MASDSEPRKFFSRPPRGPLRSHIFSGSKKPVRLLGLMTQLEFKLANSNRDSCRTTQSTVLVVFSDGTCREGFLPQCVDDEATLRMHA